MKEFWTTVQVVFAGIGGWLGWFLGGCDGLLYALLAFVVIDYITGIMCAVVDKKLSSAVGFKGIERLGARDSSIKRRTIKALWEKQGAEYNLQPNGIFLLRSAPLHPPHSLL